MRRGALLLLLASCAAGEDLAVSLAPDECVRDAMCRPGLVCRDFVCVAETGTDGARLSFSVCPPVDGPYADTHFFAGEIDTGSGAITLPLPEPAAFAYRVLDRGGAPIDARITLIGTHRIAGKETAHSETFLAARSASLKLVPDLYQVRFEPLSRAAPGVAIPFTVRAKAGAKDFTLSGDARTLRGVVSLRSDGNERLEGVEVLAVAIPSGLPSSRAETDASGAFSIALPLSDETRFRLLASFPGERPAWRYDAEVRVERGEDRTLDIGLARTEEAVRGRARLRVLGVGDAGPTPIAGALLTLSATTTIEAHAFTLTARTDEDGVAKLPSATGDLPLELIAARYALHVEPPADSPFGRLTSTLDLGRASPSLTPDKHIELPRRVAVRGRIVSSAGAAVPNALIELTSLDEPSRRLPSTTSRADGGYALWLDPGRYLARVDPFGATLEGEALPIGAAIWEIPAGAEHQVAATRLPPGVVLSGQVLGAAGEPSPRTSVEVFTSLGGRPSSVGRTRTTDDGRFSLIVGAP